MLLTIFTPTYNRGYILGRLYQSLCALDSKDFEWIIVDDGSTDNTDNIVSGFCNENKIKIRYFKKNHGGKHTAYNIGLREAEGEFFFNIDSDDYVAHDCLSHLKTIANSIRNNKHLAGYISMKSDRRGNILGCLFDLNLHTSSFDELYSQGYRGEYSIIFLTAIARQYPFPIIDGEYFMPESVIYNRMSNYRFFLDNNTMTICEYLPDGLSSIWNRLRFDNPQGFMLYHQEQADRSKRITQLIGNLISFNHYRYIAKRQGKDCRYEGKHSILASLISPISWLIDKRIIRRMTSAHEV